MVLFGVAPQVEGIAPHALSVHGFYVPLSTGIPALKIHDNIVSVLTWTSIVSCCSGPVSVVANQFTSLGVVQRLDSASFYAGTVQIFNLGLSNELWFQALSFQSVQRGVIKGPSNDEGLDDFKLGRYLANGNVLFANNQCLLNLIEPSQSFAWSSILIFSLDDVGFHANQCDCDLFYDFVNVQAMLFGVSVRANDNRFKESLYHAALSAATFGYLNITTDNQSTHCLMIRGQLFLDRYNLVLRDAFVTSGSIVNMKRSICDEVGRLQSNFAVGRG
ncbi:MAG: hypothetical protein IPP22_08075 [Nitrosomonas sp.]|nr:hypothetical protein [Nitrosomonas sp.]